MVRLKQLEHFFGSIPGIGCIRKISPGTYAKTSNFFDLGLAILNLKLHVLWPFHYITCLDLGLNLRLILKISLTNFTPRPVLKMALDLVR